MSLRRFSATGRALLLVLAPFAFAPATASADEPSPAYEVEWPQGWAVSRVPGETMCGQPGDTVRAVKEQDGSPLAAMQLMQLGRCDGGRAKLEEEMAASVRVVREKYEARGLTVNVSGHRKANLGGLPALETDIHIPDPEVDLRILMAMTFGRSHVFSFMFTARRSEYTRFQPELKSTLGTLKLR